VPHRLFVCISVLGLLELTPGNSDAVTRDKSVTEAQASSQEESVATVPGSEPRSLPHPTESNASVVMEECGQMLFTEPSVCSSFSSVPTSQQDTINEGNQEWEDKPKFAQQKGDPQHATSGYEHSSGGYSETTEETAVYEETAGANEREGNGYAIHEQSGGGQNQASAAYWEAPLQSYDQFST
uniref:Uncharacterized protein n=1 Tax=Parascaris equorum TaxID=6256 RepID=A0A914RQL0_PAREQ